MADPKQNPSLSLDTLASALEEKLDNESAILDLLVSALGRGQATEELWNKLHGAAQRDDRLAELAFSYERLSRDKKVKSLAPAQQATVLAHAGAFFADVFGDTDGAEGYLERALALAPGDVAAFEKYAEILTQKRELRRLGELFAAAAPHRGDRAAQLELLRRGVDLVEADPERALRLNTEILRLEPSDARAKGALATLYEKTHRLAELAKLLEQMLLAETPAPPEEQHATRLKLLGLYTGPLGEIDRTVPHVEEVLRFDPTHEGTRRMAEELLANKALAPRMASVLARAYEETGEPNEAARMLGIEIEALRGPKRVEAQKKLSRLTLEQLGDLEKAFALDESIVPVNPADDEVRSRFVKLASALDKQAEAIRALTRAATGTRDAAVRARIGADMGDLYRELGEPKKARSAYQSVLDAAVDADAMLRAARALRALSAEPRDPKGLAAVLSKLAEVEPEEEARLAALSELATLAETDLGDPAMAIGAWEQLATTRYAEEALGALSRLYEATGAYASLVRVLDRMAERDAAGARDLAFRAAELRATKLPDRAGALTAWRAWVARFGATRDALARIMPLLEHERAWEELAAALASDVALASAGERAPLWARLGQLRLTRLGDAAGALAAHREALAIDASERTSRAALEKMLAEGELRLAAADVLLPIARAEDSAATVVRVLEARAALLPDAGARLAALTEAVVVAHESLGDARRALDFAARGLREALAHGLDEVPTWIDRVAQLSVGEAARRAAVLREALGERAIDGEVIGLLARRAGEALVASGDVASALAVLRRALAFEPSSPELLARVDDLLREQGRPEERLALHQAALEKAGDLARRRALLHAIGAIELRDLGSPAAAAATYRRALAEDPADRVAFEALLAVHESTGAWEDLHAELASARARAAGEERAALLLRMAEVSAARGWIERAAGHYAEIVAGDAVVGDDVLAAAERVARERDDVTLLRAVLERRVAASIDPRDEADWLLRVGDLVRDRIGDAAAAAAAYRRAAAAADLLAESALSTQLFERVLTVTPEDRGAAERLLGLYREAGAWDRLPDVYGVLLRTAPDTASAARTLIAFEAPALRAGAADRFLMEAEALLARGDDLPRDARAAVRSARARVLSQDPARFAEVVAAYRLILEASDDESGAEARVFDAYLERRGAEAAAERRWLFAHREAQATDGERTAIRLAWAEAEQTVLGDPGAAIALYERVIAAEPESDAALAALSRLLLGREDFAGAAEAIERRRALSSGSARTALDLELATLLLDRLDRAVDALDAIAPALEASPHDAALRAVVERALTRPSARRRAAELFERIADAAADAASFVAAMEVLLATPGDDAELRAARRGWYERILDRPGLAPEHAFDMAVRAAGELPADLALWDRVEQIAREQRAPERVAGAYRRALGAADRGEEALPEGRLAGLSAEEIEEIGRRAVEYHEEWFDEQETVIALLRRVLDLAPASTWAFERLKLVYNLAERYDDLFALYDAAIARAVDADARRDLLEDAALAAKDLISDSARAIRYYEELLSLRHDARTRSALSRLYERHGRHRELSVLLTAELPALDGETAQKQRARIAGLWLDGVGEAGPAVAMIEEMLDAEPAGEAVQAAAFELLERVMQRTAEAPMETREARRRAAARLKDWYRAAGRADDLVRMLEIDLDAAATPEERADRLAAIVRIRLETLNDEAGAFEGLAALVTLRPQAADHRATFVRLAQKLGRTARLAEVLANAAAFAEGAEKIALLVQAAEVLDVELGDAARAIPIHQAILAIPAAPAETQLATAHRLDALLAAAGRDAERPVVLERIADLDPDLTVRRGALSDLSRIALASGDAERAVRAFRAMLDASPSDVDAEEGLARALEEAGRFVELVEVLAQRAARADDARGRADRERVARLYEHPIGDADKAIEAWLEVRRIFGPDDASTDALSSLLERGRRFVELITLLESEATVTEGARAADLWRRIGDLQREHTHNLDEAVAAYDLALEQLPGEAGARRGLEALLAGIDPSAEPTRRALAGAVRSLAKVYAGADDFAALIGLLEPRLAVAKTDADRVTILGETASLLEQRAGDAGAAFAAISRAFALVPSDALADQLIRLAGVADRWPDVADALAGGLVVRAAVPAPLARTLWWRVAEWQRDRRGDAAAAERSLREALLLDPDSIPLLTALAEAQRRAPGRELLATLLRLTELEGGPLDRYREAVEIAEGPVGDATLARTIAEKLLDAAAARFRDDASASASAAWALEALARLLRDEGREALADLFLRGAKLPFEAGERRRLRLRAAELTDVEAMIAIYEELFAEEPSDGAVSARLEATYRELGRLPALIALRERQIAVAPAGDGRAELRLDLARLFMETGDRARAIATLEEIVAGGALPAAPAALLGELYEAEGRHAALITLSEDRAAAAESAGDRTTATALWIKAATLSEERLADLARAAEAHRRAAALGAIASEGALARLLTARGDHAAAAEVLARICARTPPEAIAEPVVRLVDALRAAGKPAAARTELERAVKVAKDAPMLRERLALLYRETGEWGGLAALLAEDAAHTSDRAVRAARLREAAELYLSRAHDGAAALPLLTQAAEIAPDDTGVLLLLASARRAAGDHEGAVESLRAVIAAYGTRRPKERALVHYELALVALGKGEREKALGELDAALRIDPAHPRILLALARLSFEEGQLERAARTYRTLLLVVRRPRGDEADAPGPDDPSRAEVLLELSEIARLRGEPDRAAEHLESAFEAARETDAERDRLLAALRTRARHDVLARALDARLAGAAGPERIAVLEELASLYEEHLARPADALDARLAALASAPPSPEALARALDLARRSSQIERWVAAIGKLIDAERDAARALELLLLLASALERDAKDDARAVAALVRAEEIVGRSRGALVPRLAEIWSALSAAYDRLGDTIAQEALLGRRIAAGRATPEETADALYRLAALRLRRREAESDGLALLDRAFAMDPQPDRAESLLREAHAAGADGVAVGGALAHIARRTGRDRALIDALVLISEADPETTHTDDRLEPLREAVEIAERLADLALVESLLRRALGHAPIVGDAPLAWALLALAEHRATASDLAEAADLKERAARGASPDRERALLLEVAALAAGPLADLARAARVYEELRAREPAEHEIWQPLAEVYRKLDDRRRLAALLEETAPLLEDATERARLRLSRARMAVDEDQEKAVSLLKEVIEESPSDGEAATVLAHLLEKLGRREELSALVQKQLDAAKDREDRPAIVDLSLKLGSLLEQQWDEQGALDVYHAALDWDPKSRELLRQIVRLGMSRDDSLALGDALDQLLEVEVGEAAADLSLQLADIRGAHGDAEGAARALEQGWAARPGDAKLKQELVRRYTEAGKIRSLAELYVREADAIDDRAAKIEGLVRAAELLRDQASEPEAAAEILARALDLDPKNRDVLVALVDVYRGMDQHARAVDAIGSALAADPADPWLYRARAELHDALGRQQAALLDIEQAYEKSGGAYADDLVTALSRAAEACAARATPEARATERGLRLRLAEVLGRAGEVERARAELTELTRSDAHDRAALRALAALEERAEHWEQASDVYHRLIALEDGDALVDTALKLTDASARADRIGDARAALERAVRVAPDSTAVRTRLRDVYTATGASRELAVLLLDDAARAPDVPGRFALLVQAGRLLLGENEPGQAAAILAEAKGLRPDDLEATLLLGDALASTGRSTEARGVLESAVAAQKGRRSKLLAAVHRRIARIALSAGDRAAALAALGKAFDNDPQNGQLAMELGAIAVEHDDQELATRAFRAVTLMKSAPTGSTDGVTIQLRAVAYYHLGRMAYLQGDRRKARLMIDKAVADDPTLDAARALLDQLRAT
ncbi:DNA double-strand break repair Rad50 ATPase [Minicystis rosea]|nr:DNA double-strand break repair Rad50 ATPase [Minicystis rosea]